MHIFIADIANLQMLLEDIIQWDVKNWSKALSLWTPYVQNGKHLKCLELGSNRGGLSLWLALQGHEVICSDLIKPGEKTEELHRRHNVTDLIKYEAIDAAAIPYENHFDIITFKSILGGIGHDDNKAIQIQVIQQIYKALKPGGILLFAENLQGTSVHAFLRKKFIQWGNTWRYVSLQEMKDFLQDFSSYDIKTTGVLGAFGRSERQRNLLGVIDNILFNVVTPQNWRYIAYGVARK